MSIDFGYNEYSLMKMLGRIAAVIKNQDAHVALQQLAMAAHPEGVVGQFDEEPDVQAITGAGYLGALSSLGGSLGSLMQAQASAAVQRVVYRDSPRSDQTLQSGDVLSCLLEVIRQMKAGNQSVLAQTITGTPSAFQGQGDAALNVSVKRPLDGAVLENALAETITVLCSNDSYVGGAVVGNEGLVASGVGRQADVFSFDWPRGSGCRVGLSCIDGSKDVSTGNVLTNSGWETFTVANVPDNWEVVTGTAGTQFSQNTGITFDGLSSLQLTGSGGVLVRLRQVFGDGTLGTSGTLTPLAQYSFCGWLVRDAVAAATGTLVISLKDSNGTIIKDAALNDNSFTIDLTQLTTAWTPYRAAFRTPLVMPSTYYLEVETTVTLEAGRSVYLDRFGLGAMNQTYVGGPYLAAHSGGSPLKLDDRATVAITNSRGAGGTLSTWQTALSRLLPIVLGAELLFPSSSSPTIQDSWIQ